MNTHTLLCLQTLLMKYHYIATHTHKSHVQTLMSSSANRPEDENLNTLQKGGSVLQNYNASDMALHALLKNQQAHDMAGYDLTMEEKLALINKSMNNGVPQAYNKWDQINMNVAKMAPDNMVQYDGRGKMPQASMTTMVQEQMSAALTSPRNDNASLENLENGNAPAKAVSSERLLERSSDEHLPPPPRYECVAGGTANAGVTASEHSLSHSTEELSPERRCTALPPQPPVTKSHSITNMDSGGMRLYPMEADGGMAYEMVTTASRQVAAGTAQGQSIVRSKSASLLNAQSLQVHPGSSASSSDLLSASQRPPVTVSVSARPPPPQYKVQYASSAMPKENWSARTPVPPDQLYLPPQHSLANTNYSNRNQAPPYPMTPPQQQIWAKQDPRLLPQRSALQRQTSSSSAVSVGMGESRRVAVPEGDYLSYRDLQAGPRGPLAAANLAGPQRPLSARTYSMDGPPGMPRPHSARPGPHELPERTMSVSDFGYAQGSPGKRPGPRVKSEHSLLDGPAGMGLGRVPADWRDQVMRHIEAKKMEKVSKALSLIRLELWFRVFDCFTLV